MHLDIPRQDLKRIKNSFNNYSKNYAGYPLKKLGNHVEIESYYKHTCYEYIIDFNFEQRIVVNKNNPTTRKNFPTREIVNANNVLPWSFRLKKRYFNLKNPKIIKIPKSSYHKTCNTCIGSKNVTCNNCGGKQHYPCSSCNQKGSVRCYSCNGGTNRCMRCISGKTTCRNCGGRGSVSSGLKGVYDRTCYSCNGSGRTRCSNCGGSIYIKCNECNGTLQKRCSGCGGRGRINCSGCSGSGYKKCHSCSGKGGFEYYIGIQQSFDKSRENAFFIADSKILNEVTIKAELVKSEKIENTYKSADFLIKLSSLLRL